MTSKKNKTKTRRVWAGAVVAAACGGWSAVEIPVGRAESVPTVDFVVAGQDGEIAKSVATDKNSKVVDAGRACEPLNPAAPGRLPKTLDGLRLAPDFGCFWGFSVAKITERFSTPSNRPAPSTR